jgi:hypothetical protein
MPSPPSSISCARCRRPNGLLRFRCRACREDFTITSGTLFAFHKLPLRGYLVAIAIFCNELKGKSALAISRDLGVSYKASFVFIGVQSAAMRTDRRAVCLRPAHLAKHRLGFRIRHAEDLSEAQGLGRAGKEEML